MHRIFRSLRILRNAILPPHHLFQRNFVGLFAMPRTVFEGRKLRFENLAAGLSGQCFESAFGGQVAQVLRRPQIAREDGEDERVGFLRLRQCSECPEAQSNTLSHRRMPRSTCSYMSSQGNICFSSSQQRTPIARRSLCSLWANDLSWWPWLSAPGSDWRGVGEEAGSCACSMTNDKR
jgi:hypothetical protein